MIPCPDCDHLCGIRDAVLVDDELFYRCAHCLTAFDAERQLHPERFALESDIFDDVDPPSVWDEVTPLVTPPHLLVVDPEERIARGQIDETPPLGTLVALTSQRLPTLPPPDPLAFIAEHPTPPPPRHPTPLSFTVFEPPTPQRTIEPTPVLPTGAIATPGFVLRRIANGIVAASAVVGIAVVIAMFAAKNEPLPHDVQAPAPRLAAAPPDATTFELDPLPATALPPPAAKPAVPEVPVVVAHVGHATARAQPTLTRAELLAAEGDRAFRAGEFERASSLYDQALVVSPVYVPARLGAAAADWERGKRDRARMRYQAIAADNPRALPDALADRAR